jgi:lipoprotein-anchoring transpeptidase ErfK/SrfK
MRHRSFIFVAVLVAVLVVGAVAVYAYDSSRDDLIAEGVTVADVDVGGMRADEARSVLQEEVAAPLERPVTVTYGRRKFTLSARKARIRADVGGMVDEALAESRDGNLVSRATRDLTGGEVDASIRVRVSYSKEAARALARRVSRNLRVPVRDAEVTFSTTGLGQVESRDGRAVRAGRLKRRIAAALVQPSGDRVVKAPVKVLKPKVTTAQLTDRYPYVVTIDRGNFRLRFFKDLRLVKSYEIAVGMAGLETPAGLYHIQNKGVNVPWSVPNSPWAGALAGKVIPGGAPDNPIKARWLGIYDGAGIHGTDQTSSLGTAASHGCIRMSIPEVKELYAQVPVRTPVYIG